MRKVLHAEKDHSNPISSGYERAKQWSENNAPDGWFITSHMIGTRTNAYQKQEDTYVYEVCIDDRS